MPFVQISGVGEVNGGFDGKNEEPRDSFSFLVLMHVSVDTRPWNVTYGNHLWSCDLEKDPKCRQTNLHSQRFKRNIGNNVGR